MSLFRRYLALVLRGVHFKKNVRCYAKLLGACVLMVFLAVSVFAQNPAAGQRRIRGTVESFNEPTLVVKADDGQSFSIMVPDELRIMANAKSSLAYIKPGDFVGSAAIKGADGKMHARTGSPYLSRSHARHR